MVEEGSLVTVWQNILGVNRLANSKARTSVRQRCEGVGFTKGELSAIISRKYNLGLFSSCHPERSEKIREAKRLAESKSLP